MPDTQFDITEIEKALVGSLLIDSSYLPDAEVDPTEFKSLFYADIFQAMCEMDARGETVNVLTVASELQKQEQYREISLLNLCFDVPLISSGAITTYADQIRYQARNRQALDVASKIAKATGKDGDLVSTMAGLVDEFVKANGESAKGVQHISVFANELMDEVDEAIKNPRDRWGLATGFNQFDDITGGVQPGEVIVLSGEPGIGKSSYALQLCIGMAKNGIPGAIYELEMKGKALVRRAVSNASGVFARKLRTGRMNGMETDLFVQGWSKVSKLPIFMSEETNWTTLKIKADLSRAISLHGVRWVLIDYMGLLQDELSLPSTERSALISDRIHAIAKDLDVAVIAVHDMTKAGISGEGAGQAQVAGSRKVLFNAHQIIVLRKEDDSGNNLRAKWEKFREGLAGSYIKLERIPGFTEFKEVAR